MVKYIDLAVAVAVTLITIGIVVMVFHFMLDGTIDRALVTGINWVVNLQSVCVRTPSCYAACDNSRFVDLELVEWKLLDFNEFPQNNFTCECVYRNCAASPVSTFITEGNIEQTRYHCTNETRLRVFNIRRDCYG